jgi:hypothetical protein
MATEIFSSVLQKIIDKSFIIVMGQVLLEQLLRNEDLIISET